MSYFGEAFVWLNDPLNWTNPGGLLERLGEHLVITLLAVLISCAIGWPAGIWLGRRGRGGSVVVTVTNLGLAIPTLALLVVFAVSPLGYGKLPVAVALSVLAVPPLLANAYTGLRSVDPEIREAARGMGLSEAQLLRRVELPLSVPYLAAGLRTATVQIVATAGLAAWVSGGGLGQIIYAGFGIGLYNGGGGQIVAGALAVALLALLVEALLAGLQRLVTPRALRARPNRGPAEAAPAG